MSDSRSAHFIIKAVLPLVAALSCWSVQVYSQHIPFKHLTVEEGLSQNSVVSIAQDSLGFMWFATRNGLNRYDGYEFRVFESQPDDSLSLSSNAVNSLEVLSGTVLWIGTAQGLCMWDQRIGKIVRMNSYFDKDTLKGVYNIGDLHVDSQGDLWVMASMGGFHIFQRKKGERMFHKRLTLRDLPGNIEGFYGQFMEDRIGNVWIGTSRRGIWIYNRTKDSFAPLPASQSLDTLAVTSMLCDKSGTPWIGTLKGLYTWKSSTSEFVPVPGLNDPIVRSLYMDRNGRVWVGTDRGGLNLYDNVTHSFKVYNESTDGTGLLHNSVQSIYGDRQGILWVGTYAGGVNYHDPNPGKFYNYQVGTQGSPLNSNIITAFAEDQDENLWIATDRGGLSYIDHQGNRFKNFRNRPGDSESLSTDIIQHIGMTRDGDLLIGTWQSGLDIYDPRAGKFFHNRYQSGDHTSLVDNSVNYAMQDSQGKIWVGTTRGVNISREIIDHTRLRSPLSFVTYQYDPGIASSLSNNYVTRILEDKRKRIWIATSAGVNLWDTRSKTFINFENNPEDRALFNRQHIHCIDEDEDDNLLLGTNENGLIVYHYPTDSLVYYTKRDGLPSNTVVGLQRGSNDDWWISTSNGLTRFDIKTRKFQNYNRHDGLPSNEFRVNANACLRNGELLFGGNNGFTRFHPDSIKTNRHPPQISFTAFRLFNQVVEPAAKGVLTSDISMTDHVELSAYQSSFGIDFIGINYTASQKNTYAYRMEGIDEDWNLSGSQHAANYSYLPPGDYRFLARSANSDGYWSKPISILITIKPYWWNTTWFRVLAIVSIFAGIGLVFRIRTRQLIVRKKVLEQTVRERTTELEGKNRMLSDAKEELQMQTVEIQSQRDNIEEQLRTIQALNEIGHKITAYLKKDELVTSIHSIINTFMDAPHLSIGSISGNKDTIEFSTVRDIGSPIAEISVSLAETDRLSVASISRNEVIVLHDLPSEVGSILQNPSPRYRSANTYRSAVYIPLMSMHGVVTQILIVKNFQNSGFSNIHVDILKSLGAYIGIAYENAHVYKEIKAQSELLSEQTEKLKELNDIKSRFFINMSHEFKTPLTLIISPLEQLLEHDDEPDWAYVRHQLFIMDKNARQLLGLINRLLELRNVELKVDKPNVEKLDIVPFLKSVMMQFEYLAERHAIHYKIITEGLPVFVNIDREMMEKVFMNLYSNAFKYTPKGGSITTTLAVKSNGDTSFAEIQISDSGKGIERKDLPFIFERFYQGDEPLHTLQESTGIGLSMVKDFVELHSGSVKVDSELKKGTTFSVTLPFEDVQLVSDLQLFERDEDQNFDDQQESKLVPLLLLIDDNRDVLDFLTLSFESEFRILRAENGKGR